MTKPDLSRLLVLDKQFTKDLEHAQKIIRKVRKILGARKGETLVQTAKRVRKGGVQSLQCGHARA